MRLLEQRQRVRQAGVIIRHPLVACFVTLCLMLIGALISKIVEASIPLILSVLFVTGMLTTAAMQIGAVWRSREYRDEELTEFVMWLWAEAAERKPSTGQ